MFFNWLELMIKNLFYSIQTLKFDFSCFYILSSPSRRPCQLLLLFGIHSSINFFKKSSLLAPQGKFVQTLLVSFLGYVLYKKKTLSDDHAKQSTWPLNRPEGRILEEPKLFLFFLMKWLKFKLQVHYYQQKFL